VSEYLAKFYLPATRQGRRYAESNFEAARRLAEWKKHVRNSWPKLSMRRLDALKKRIAFGDNVRFEVGVDLDGLKPEDVRVELLIAKRISRESDAEEACYQFQSEGVRTEKGEHRFVLELSPENCGKLGYRIRMYPHHELLTHPFEMGMMRWL
jgi:starch phosphorylase